MVGYVKVFYSLNPSKSFKQEVFRYYKKTKKAMRILELYGIPTHLIFDTLTDKRFYIKKLLDNNILLRNSLIPLLTKQLLLQKVIKVFKINSKFSWAKLNCILRSFLLLKNTDNYFQRFKKLKFVRFNLKRL
jgi:hypothetical protein